MCRIASLRNRSSSERIVPLTATLNRQLGQGHRRSGSWLAARPRSGTPPAPADTAARGTAPAEPLPRISAAPALMDLVRSKLAAERESSAFDTPAVFVLAAGSNPVRVVLAGVLPVYCSSVVDHILAELVPVAMSADNALAQPCGESHCSWSHVG